MEPPYTKSRVAAAWGVHLYTALGLPLAFFATLALFKQDVRLFFLLLCVAVFVDASDGTLARLVRVKEVLPDFSGRRLDDIVDFLTFVFLPSLALPALGMLPPGWEFFAAVPLMASGYGFCQERAKTEESFVGFPSYWNIILLYLYVLDADPWATVGVLGVLALLVFVPIHYVYPTKTRMLRKTTVVLGCIWSITMVIIAWRLDAEWAPTLALFSLLYPAYYCTVSFMNHRNITRAS